MKVVVKFEIEMPFETHLDPDVLARCLKEDNADDLLGLKDIHLGGFMHDIEVRFPRIEDGSLFDSPEDNS